jgi:hypothetical protein
MTSGVAPVTIHFPQLAIGRTWQTTLRSSSFLTSLAIRVIEKEQPTVPPPPPRIVAISGIAFTVLLSASLLLIRVSVPSDPRDPGVWLADPLVREWVGTALNLVPFAGLAFLWFMATLRNHIGMLEDWFFATIFLGSGFLFVAMLFAAVAVSQGVLVTFAGSDSLVAQSEGYRIARVAVYAFLNFFGMRMAAVFMFVTSMIGLRTSVLSKSVSLAGFVLGLLLLTVINQFAWIALLFPLWVLMVSTYILFANVDREKSLS